jgi:hypothetical protein
LASDFPALLGNIKCISFGIFYFILGKSDSRKRVLNLNPSIEFDQTVRAADGAVDRAEPVDIGPYT